jgi:hypothetical protein
MNWIFKCVEIEIGIRVSINFPILLAENFASNFKVIFISSNALRLVTVEGEKDKPVPRRSSCKIRKEIGDPEISLWEKVTDAVVWDK